MSFLTKLFKKKSDENDQNTGKGSVDEFASLIRVYYQAVIAINLGITNLNMLQDLALFKRMLKIPTQNNKLGIAERSKVIKILMQDYGLPQSFFTEIDQSIKKNCRNQQQVQTYFFQFQGFNNDLFMLMDNLMQIKFRFAMLFKKMLRAMTEKTVHDIMTKTEWKEVSEQKAAWKVRKYAETLGFSEQWITDYVYNILLLAKSDSKRQRKEDKEDK
ncbi:MAG TPA: hypothetical protein DCF91_06420 [Porphyromonadaceae bacterium]|nr:hypothetical protein [Porphyromonadaceae bacterium]